MSGIQCITKTLKGVFGATIAAVSPTYTDRAAVIVTLATGV